MSEEKTNTQNNELDKIKKGEKVSVIRFTLTKENILKLQHVICGDGYVEQNDCFVLKSYTNIGNDRNIERIYKKDNKTPTKHFERNQKYFISNEDENAPNFIILEVLCFNDEEKDDVILFQYLLLLLNYLDKKRTKFTVFVCKQPNKYEKRLYAELNSDVFFKIRHFLYAYSNKELESGKYRKILNRIYGYYSVKGKVSWKHFWKMQEEMASDKSNNKKEDHFGRILPVIPIVENSYKAIIAHSLTSDNSLEDSSEQWKDTFHKLYEDYFKRIREKHYKEYKEKHYKEYKDYFKRIENKLYRHYKSYFEEIEKKHWEKISCLAEIICEYDTWLEKIIFVATLCYTDDVLLHESKITRIHEQCNDFSQGLSQIIENALFYAVDDEKSQKGENSDKGCASFTIRIRKKSDFKFLNETSAAGKNDTDNKQSIVVKNIIDAKYFMELYVTDLLYDKNNFKGIVKTFLTNVEKRGAEHLIKKLENKILLAHVFGNTKNPVLKEDFEIEKYIKGYSPKLKNDLLAKYKNSMEEAIKGYRSQLNEDLTILEKLKKEYYSESENVAYHYGLQILNSVVKTNKGYFYVVSGNDYKKDVYSDGSILHQNKTLRLYKEEDASFVWKGGTAYIIYLPISVNERTNSYDTLAPINNDVDGYEIIEIRKKNILDIYLKSNFIETDLRKRKEERVNTLKGIMLDNSFINNGQNDEADLTIYKIQVDESKDLLFVMDCKEWAVENYEILAKALFLCLKKEKEDKDKNLWSHLAFINIKNRQNVIKLFREFALFYDRNGNNYFMDKRSIFFIDVDAKTEILLGGQIKDINKNMQLGLIYGGMDSDTAEIIKYLGRSNDEGGGSK